MDGALFSNQRAGHGFVFRNHLGKVLSCGGSSLTHWDAAQVELLALTSFYQGISPEFYDTKGLIIEGDCLNVFRWFKEFYLSKAWTGPTQLLTTMDCISKFNCVVFNIIPRNCNRLAHACAHYAISYRTSFVWDDIPCTVAPLFTVLEEDLGIG